ARGAEVPQSGPFLLGHPPWRPSSGVGARAGARENQSDPRRRRLARIEYASNSLEGARAQAVGWPLAPAHRRWPRAPCVILMVPSSWGEASHEIPLVSPDALQGAP